jgi:hypothetical protein
VIASDDRPDSCQWARVPAHGFVTANSAHEQHHRERIHGNALEPTETARNELGDLREVETSERRRRSNDECERDPGIADGGANPCGAITSGGCGYPQYDDSDRPPCRNECQKGEKQLCGLGVHTSSMQRGTVRSLAMSSDSRITLRELRQTRKQRRLGDTDWYDVAYRVYLFGLLGLTAVVVASDAITGVVGDGVDSDDLLTRGPSIMGILVMLAFAMGLRSGADGGPVSIEVADIRHVLLAPVSREMVMLRPISQRMRSIVFGLALTGAVLGQLVATELEGSRAAWAASVGIFGAIVGAVFVSTAVISHALRVPRWAATLIGGIALTWQVLVAWGIWTGEAIGIQRVAPGNLAGRIAFWGISQRPIDIIAIVVTLAMVAAALALGGRLRLEPLARRGELVSQLRFAATVQDLRTVVLLRRQLRAEALRDQPWGLRPGRLRGRSRTLTTHRFARLSVANDQKPSPTIVWRRGIQSLRRLPLSRITRMVSLAVIGGAAASLTVSSSPLFALLLLVTLFLVGLESVEPLSQEVDRPDLTDMVPIERGWIFVNHLVAPSLLLAVMAIVGATTATLIDPDQAAAAFALAIPVAWAGAMGPVVATVLDAPPPIAAQNTTLTGAPRNSETSLVPPEFAGFSTAFRSFLPIAISAIGTAPVLAMRFSADAATIGRSIVGVALFIALVAWWVRRHDSWSVKFRAFTAEGRAATT